MLQLSTPSGLVDVTLVGLTVTEHTISAEFDMAADVHDHALADGWFHLGPLSRGDGARPFAAGSDVRVRARLDPRLVGGLDLVVSDAAGVTELWTKLHVDSPLRSQASWYACSATREVPLDGLDGDPTLAAAAIDGALREGYRTAWGGDVAVPGLPIVASLTERLEHRFHDMTALVDTMGFQWRLAGRDASWTTSAVVDESASWCVLRSRVDTPRPTPDRELLVAHANDLNAALLFGAWYVAVDPPTVGFRSGLELADRTAAPALLDQLITRHLDIVDEYASTFA